MRRDAVWGKKGGAVRTRGRLIISRDLDGSRADRFVAGQKKRAYGLRV